MTVKFRLSYNLSKNTPLYGGIGKIDFPYEKNINNGDTCNTHNLFFNNHAGTHIDAPYHFDNYGKKICDYNIDDFIFNRPAVIEIPKKAGELLISNDLKNDDILKRCCNADLILIKTGFGKFRGIEDYYLRNPGISESAINFIRENFKSVRCLGIDTISVSSFMHREEGRKSHRAALQCNPEILLIEDMNLMEINSSMNIKKVYCIPLFIENIDASPVTVFAEL